METLEWTTIDKSTWMPGGKWHREPDKAQWQDDETGLPCLIVRGPSGALCGYVGVSEGHPFFGVEYDNCEHDALYTKEEDGWERRYPLAHGGLTFSDFCHPKEDPSKGICHTVEEGENDRVWWLGFDCAHAGDLCPKYGHHYPIGGETYKDIEYVRREVRDLAAQLALVS